MDQNGFNQEQILSDRIRIEYRDFRDSITDKIQMGSIAVQNLLN